MENEDAPTRLVSHGWVKKPAIPFIVAELSKNWRNGASLSPLLLAQQFELAIEHNRQRGYRLHSFQLHRLMVAPDEMNETIIAVFEIARCTCSSPYAGEPHNEACPLREP